jgi:two-component system, NarL family, sensor kinase
MFAAGTRLQGACRKTARFDSRRGSPAQVFQKSYWDRTPDGLFVVQVEADGGFSFGDINPSFERIAGLSRAAVRGCPVGRCLPVAAAAIVEAHYRECVLMGEPIRYTEALDLPDGPRRWETTLVPVREPPHGAVTHLIGTVRDVTLRWRAEREAGQSFLLMQSALDAIGAPIALLDGAGTILLVNRAWDDRHARAAQRRPSWIGTSYLAARTSLKAAPGPEARIRAELDELFAGRRNEILTIHRLAGRSEERWIQLRATRFAQAGADRVVILHEDVTEAVIARREVNAMAERVLVLQDEERRRITADLHDSTGQHLVAAGLSLARLRPLAQGSMPADALLDEIAAALGDAQQEMRALTFLLRPPELDGLGLARTLRHFVQGFARRTGLKASLTVTGAADDLPFPIQRTILRIVQEALVNVHRHAGASEVRIRLARKARGLALSVRDDGRGLEAGIADPDAACLGVGIPGMRTRVSQLGGAFRIAARGRGTGLIATIPADRPETV